MNTRITKALIAAGIMASVCASHAIHSVVDLTAANQTAVINGATFTTTDNASTGTGLIQSFVRLTTPGNSPNADPIEQGFNSSARPVMDNVNTSPSFTTDLLLSSVPIVNGAYEFLLDVNQTANNPLLSLDQLKIYTSATPLTSADELSDLLALNLGYDMDGAGDTEVVLNYLLNNGSGSGDLFVYIPTAMLAGGTYVTLYSAFGQGLYGANDGFEEWAVRKATPTTSVPDGGATAALLGLGVLGLAAVRRKM